MRYALWSLISGVGPQGVTEMTGEQMLAIAMKARAAKGLKVERVVEGGEVFTAYFATPGKRDGYVAHWTAKGADVRVAA